MLLASCLVIGIPVVIALNPPVDVVSFGQHIGVGARAPDLSVAGPAQLVQVGNTLRLHDEKVPARQRGRDLAGALVRDAHRGGCGTALAMIGRAVG